MQEAIAAAPVPVQVLRGRRDRCDQTLLRLQVTTRSVLGALVHQTGGVLVDNGWLRHLGGGCAGLPDVATANAVDEAGRPTVVPGALVVAHDVLGGRFAVNVNGLPGDEGEVHYFAPDSLKWEPMEVGHAEFVAWSMSGATGQFYLGSRWPGWEDEVARLSLAMGIGLYPPPFSEEGQDPSLVHRSPVPWEELEHFYDDAARQLG